MTRNLAACFVVAIVTLGPAFAQQAAIAPAKPPLPDNIDVQWRKAEDAVKRAAEKYAQANQRALEEFAKQVARIDPNRDVMELCETFKAVVILQQNGIANDAVEVPVLGRGIIVGPNNHKYKLFEDNLSWEDAKKMCEQEGGHLLVIDDQSEYDFIRQKLSPALVPGNDTLWMGARKNQQGAWTWVTGQQMANMRWAQNFPVPDGGKDFLVMNGNGKFINERGNNRPGMRFICEWDR